MKPYERLHAWRAGHELALAIYTATTDWPKHELYALTSQLRRAACSVPINIAEGAAKRGKGEFRRFLDISLGSHSEVTYILQLARDLRYLDDDAFARLAALADKSGKLIWGLYTRMRT